MFYFLPADIVSQTLNLGLPAPFDVQVYGRDQAACRAIATRLADKIRRVPGAVDVRVQQPADQPRLTVNVNREKAVRTRPHRTRRGQLRAARASAAAARCSRPTG